MLSLVFAACILIVVVNAETTPSCEVHEAPCRYFPCVPFTVLEKNKMYEVREYKAGNWIMASEKNDMKSNDQFIFTVQMLHSYLQGNNKMNKILPMSLPMITLVTNNTAPEITVFFHLPEEGNPEPLSPNIKLISLPKKRVYAKCLNRGPISHFKYEVSMEKGEPDSIAKEGLKALMLEVGGGKYIEKYYLLATYNYYSRLNDEVWLEAK